MKGMAIPAVPRSDDRSVYQHYVGRGVQVMTTISRVVLEQASRRGGAGAPSQSSTKGKRPRKGSNSQVRLCGKVRVVGKI